MKKLAIAFLFILASCTTIEEQKGAEIRQVKLERVVLGSNKGDVINALGNPSTKSTYGKETWYYISSKKQQQIISRDKTLEQEIVAITFDATQKVENIELYSKDDMRKVALAKDKTPTAGHEMGMMEQLLGNIGKFNAADKLGGGTTGSPNRSGRY
jgi:outer membrane protein assembly factor BamE (lipoprotein component of BamABCDE complex)